LFKLQRGRGNSFYSKGVSQMTQPHQSRLKPGSFGRNLKEILQARDMDQETLAKRSGLTPAAISQFINNKREPTLESICKILKALHVKFERLVHEN
jgi:plasmid maintenance system antidote protein VapI